MQTGVPKQYLRIEGHTILALTLARLSSLAPVERVMLVLNPEDTYWSRQHADTTAPDKVMTCAGGKDRWQSVLNGLDALSALAGADDWVLVHDAVRPCVRVADMLQLLELAVAGGQGGLLALPVTDTLKRANNKDQVSQTVDREQLWAACTPQLFPFHLLQQNLRSASQAGITLTDEASAMEWAGGSPHLVPCHKDNIKITYHEDLQLAELILRAQQIQSDMQNAAEPQPYTGIFE